MVEKIKIEKKDKSVRVFLSGHLTVEDAILLKEKLAKTLKTAEKVEIVFDEEVEMHTAVVQLIMSLQKHLIREGRQFSTKNVEASSVREALEGLGCARFLVLS